MLQDELTHIDLGTVGKDLAMQCFYITNMTKNIFLKNAYYPYESESSYGLLMHIIQGINAFYSRN